MMRHRRRIFRSFDKGGMLLVSHLRALSEPPALLLVELLEEVGVEVVVGIDS